MTLSWGLEILGVRTPTRTSSVAELAYTTPPTQKTMSKQAKKAKIEKAAIGLSRARSILDDNERLLRLAESMIAPGEYPPRLFPSLIPTLAGAARFPLVVSVTGQSEFGIIAKPSLTAPLKISHTAGAIAENQDLRSAAFTFQNGVLTTISAHSLDLSVEPQVVAGRLAIPLNRASGTTTFTWSPTFKNGKTSVLLYLSGYDTSTSQWTLISTTNRIGVGGIGSQVIANLTWVATYSHYSFGISSPYQESGAMSFYSGIQATANGFSDAPLYDQSVMDTYIPEWTNLLGDSEKVRIVAMDCLVTYEGSTLDNSGSIAGCNTDTNLQLGSGLNWYETVARRPSTMYRGRLASAGQSDGGSHWHYVPSSPEQILLTRIGAYDDTDVPAGYFGISGMDSTQTVRVEVQITLNFYSNLPQYEMSYQPPFTYFSVLLWVMLKDVPIVTSNDSHLKKLLRMVKKGSKTAIKFVMDNPEMVLKGLMMAGLV